MTFVLVNIKKTALAFSQKSGQEKKYKQEKVGC